MILSIKPEKAGRMESAITSSFFLGALVSLVVITNPLTKIPLFLSLTEGWSSGRRRSEAAHAALDAFFIMVASLVAGNLLLSFFGISYGAIADRGRLCGSRDRKSDAVWREDAERFRAR